MYRVVKSKLPAGYAVHKVNKVVKGEVYIDADPLFKANTMAELEQTFESIKEAFYKKTLDTSDVVKVHNTLWHEDNENNIPFYDDISDEVLEQEFMNEHTFSDDDKAHARW